MSGTVDVAVPEGVVLLLVLGVELGGGDGGDSSTNFSNHWSSLGDDRGSSNSRGSNSVDSSNSRGSNSVDSSNSRGSNSADSSNSRGSNSVDSRCSHNRGSSYC